MSNYPPGVSGNEPEITGIWPIEKVADAVCEELRKAESILEDQANILDDQGHLTKELDEEFFAAISKIQSVHGMVDALIPF